MRNTGIPQNYIPTVTEVNQYIDKWKGLENYVDQENALDNLFITMHLSNDSLDYILLKISVLNDFYSTHIMDVHNVAKHFQTIDIDERLKANDETLVDDLSHVKMTNGRSVHFYSFATKYCSHHKPYNYPIYDKYVGMVLKFFRKRDEFAPFKNEDLLIYPNFKSIIDSFRSYYGIEQFDYKRMDKYLWQLGKEYYMKKY